MARKKRTTEDMNQIAFRVVQEVIRRSEEVRPQKVIPITGAKPRPAAIEGKNPAAVALGRLGGLKGGKARAEKIGAERRREIASKAARARWSKKPEP